MAETIFPGKFIFVVNYGFSFFGEIPFYYFPATCFSSDWLISFFWFLAQRCKMVTEPDFRIKKFGQIWAKNNLKIGFLDFAQDCFIIYFWFWQKDRGQGCLKSRWSNFFPEDFCLSFNIDFRIWRNSLLPFSFYQLLLLFMSSSIQAAHCIFLLSGNFYLTFIIR